MKIRVEYTKPNEIGDVIHRYGDLKPSELLSDLIVYLEEYNTSQDGVRIPNNTLSDLSVILFQWEHYNTHVRELKELHKGKSDYYDNLLEI